MIINITQKTGLNTVYNRIITIIVIINAIKENKTLPNTNNTTTPIIAKINIPITEPVNSAIAWKHIFTHHILVHNK